MRRYAYLLLSLLLLILASASPAQEAQDDLAVFLSEARKAHLDLTARGLQSFSAELTMRRSVDVNMRRYKNLAGFGYSWSAPELVEFDFEKTHKSLHKPYQDTLRDFWRDVTGAIWFDTLEKLQELRMEEDAYTVLSGKTEKGMEIRASFETGTKKLVELEVPASKAKVTIVYDRTEGGYRVSWREVSVNDAMAYRLSYGVFRKVSGFELPTILKLVSKANSTEYRVRYLSVNGESAQMEALSDAEVEGRVKAFEDGWRKWSEGGRIANLQELSDVEDDRVSAAIAKRGLKDRSPDVRERAAESLGVMGRENVVPALIAAMKKNEKVIDVYLALIEALGEIADPRAVDILSKDWWTQRIGENAAAAAKAKIHALGNIKHPSAVDALIDTFFMTSEDKVGIFKADLVAALTKLTGQDLRYDRRAWKDWWKKNRASYEFE